MNGKFRTAPYDRVLPRAIVTAHGTYKSRQGVIVRLSDDQGRVGLGDAAPLPGFSRDTFEDLCQGLTQLASGMSGDSLEYVTKFYESSPNLPSLTFGLGTAIEDLNARALDVPLSHWLNRESAPRVAINGLIGDGSAAVIGQRARELWQEGFRVFKVKVAAGKTATDIERILAVIEATPEVKLRLDANAGWTVDQASEVLKQIPRANIDCVEQPLTIGQIKESRQLCSIHGVRLALDEEATTVETARSIISQRACEVIVLKPMVLGSFRACFLLAQEARERDIEVIYTSSWESDIGIAATLHLAAALGTNPPAMGLSTAGMIAEGIVKSPLKIEGGYLEIPKGPGLGMELVPEFLSRLG